MTQTRRLLPLLPAFIVAVSLAPRAAHAQRAGVNPVSLTETAVHLAENGAAANNARTLAAAADILRMVERGSPRVHRVGESAGPSGRWDGPLSSRSLLRLASKIAGDEGDWATADYVAWLLQLPDSVPATRGAAGGPVWADGYLARKQEATFTIDFDGGQTPNLIRVSSGKADAALECVLEDAADSRHAAVHARSVAGTCSLEWRQSAAGRVTLRIRNAGNAMYFVMSSN